MNLKNDKILEGLVEEIVDLGGDIHTFYEEHNPSSLPVHQAINLLTEYRDELKESVQADVDARREWEQTR